MRVDVHFFSEKFAHEQQNRYLCVVILKHIEIMKISELTRLISRAGCYLLKHKTRHDLWINPVTGETLLIPRHQSEEVPKGLEKAAKKWAGVE